MIVALAMALFHASGRPLHPDTVYYYKTWHQIFKLTPKAVVIDPVVNTYSPYRCEFLSGDDELNKAFIDDYLAVSLDLSTWYINCEYIKRNFSGDTQDLNGYIPLYYNDKIAYVLNGYISYWSTSAYDVAFNGNEDDGIPYYDYNIYYLDFVNRTVKCVNHSYLSELLTDYHDLQMRYEGMKDYKKQYVIEDYFFKYIDRATQDIMHPYILDLVEFNDENHVP